MSTVQTQVRIDSNVKKQANDLFSALGLDMSSAVNLFLHQCILRGGLPFSVEMPKYKQSTIDAMEEGLRISKDPNVKGYYSMEDLRKALDEWKYVWGKVY